MDVDVGLVVRAKAGRDKGNFFVIVQIDGNYAYICDGKRRKLSKPKKKKFIHLSITKTKFKKSEIQTDKSIKSSLKLFEKSC